ncbi:MAG: TIGR02757 family protein, partial [Bacteroidota bacterium]
GNRISILKSANKMMQRMGDSPFDFVMNSRMGDGFNSDESIHRTFNGEDFWFFIQSLRRIYTKSEGLESVFQTGFNKGGSWEALLYFREVFMNAKAHRASKHIADVGKNSSAKRLNMFLRWMVRKDRRGVDLGIWNTSIDQSNLSIPLDVHSGATARKLGLLKRSQNDWSAVEELDFYLRTLDPKDPVKYDYALFGLGESGKLT